MAAEGASACEVGEHIHIQGATSPNNRGRDWVVEVEVCGDGGGGAGAGADEGSVAGCSSSLSKLCSNHPSAENSYSDH